jgi:hypothetical protein
VIKHPSSEPFLSGFKRRYWLAAPQGFDAHELETAFAQRGWVGEPRVEDPASVIPRVHLVVGIVGPPGSNERVFFEIGIAVGRQKNVTLLLAADSQTLPEGLAEGSTYSLDDLASALESVEPIYGPSVARSTAPLGTGLGGRADEFIAALDAADSSATVNVLAEAFALLGARTYVEARTSTETFTVDLGLWEPTLSAQWNPVLVEVKRINGPNRARILQAVKQLQLYCQSADARLGLVILTSDSAPVDVQSALIEGVVILTFSADYLLEQLRSRRLGPIVMDRIAGIDPSYAGA